MRKFLILALGVVVTSATVEAEPQFAVYTVLKDHPECSGPGHIAYEARFDTLMAEAGYIRPVDPAAASLCTVTMRKGNEIVETTVPCPFGESSDITEAEIRSGYCTLTPELRPAEIRVQGSLTGCITITGHSFVDGKWTATTTRPNGTTVTEGGHDDPRLEAEYHPSTDGVVGNLNPSLGIWLRLPDETVSKLPGSVVEVAAAANGILALRLVDGSDPKCAADPTSYWSPSQAKSSATRDEGWVVCGDSLQLGKDRPSIRDAPEREEN